MTVQSRPPVRVLVIDDTATIRALLRAILDADPRFVVVGEATDAYDAREKIRSLSPDVLTLDVEMPGMNGIEFLERLMRVRPMPVIMVSNLTRERSEAALRALSAGAIDCVDLSRVHGDPRQRHRLLETIDAAAGARVGNRPRPAAERSEAERFRWNGRVVLIGSSTGGVDALERIFGEFPANGPPVVVAQHMPENFLASFAARLNDRIAPVVCMAEEGMTPRQGTVLIAPGGERQIVFGRGERLHLPRADPGDLYTPSIDTLFRSAVPLAARLVAVILTGMGRDGAQAMVRLREAGALTLAQSGESCIVDGMPRAAREAGAAGEVVALPDMARHVLALCARSRRGSMR